MSEFLVGVVVGVMLSVASSRIVRPLLAAVRTRHTIMFRRQDREDVRVLRAFRELSDRDPNGPVAMHEVGEVAKVPMLIEAIGRLKEKGYVVKHPDGPYCFTITDEGRRAASERRAR